jgi:hypothetical protein
MSKVRDHLTRSDLSKTTKYMLIVGHHIGPAKNADIRKIAKENGWRAGSQSSPSDFLKLKREYCVSLPEGWELTGPGRSFLEQEGLISPGGILTPVTEQLDRYLLDVHDPQKASFIAEAVGCVKNKQPRAAIVLSWVGAVYLLYSHVVATKLNEFNTEARRRWAKIKDASDIDDLARMKESDFLSVIEHLRVISRAEAKELAGCLDRRNTAGHPNSHNFEEVTVGHHIQTLITAVYLKF